MKRWVWSGIVIAAGVIVIACGERRTEMPSGPMASVTALTTLPACDLSGTNSLVSQYFNSTDAKTVRTLIDQIGTAGAGTVTARDRGFDIIAIIAQNAQAGTGGDASAGSTLITSVRYPRRDNCRPVAAAILVFPTPPLPLNKRMRITPFYR